MIKTIQSRRHVWSREENRAKDDKMNGDFLAGSGTVMDIVVIFLGIREDTEEKLPIARVC